MFTLKKKILKSVAGRCCHVYRFLHPWSATTPTPASAYTAQYSATTAATPGISVNGFYQHQQHHHQQQHYQGSVGLTQPRHVTGSIATDLHQSPGRSHSLQVPVAMVTPAGTSFLQQQQQPQQSIQYNSLGAVGTAGSAFDSVTGKSSISIAMKALFMDF